MQTVIEFIAGLVALLAAAALAHLGVDLERRAPEPAQAREIHRVSHCAEPAAAPAEAPAEQPLPPADCA